LKFVHRKSKKAPTKASDRAATSSALASGKTLVSVQFPMCCWRDASAPGETGTCLAPRI
jgi:hypothetical protein